MTERTFDLFVENMKRKKVDFQVIFQGNSKRLKCDKISFGCFDKLEAERQKQIWVVGAVKKSVLKYLCCKQFSITELPEFRPCYQNKANIVNKVNVDICHAYWQMAHRQSVISTTLYDKCKSPEYKFIRNVALSCMTRQKRIDYYIKGEFSHSLYEDNEPYQIVYGNIRNGIFSVMNEIKEELDGDCCYNIDGVDCDKENLPKVISILENHNLLYKVAA